MRPAPISPPPMVQASCLFILMFAPFCKVVLPLHHTHVPARQPAAQSETDGFADGGALDRNRAEGFPCAGGSRCDTYPAGNAPSGSG